MSRIANYKNKEFGDFKVVKRLHGNKFMGKCRHCGHEKCFVEATVKKGYPAKCPKCNKTYKVFNAKKKKGECYPERKITRDTYKLVCWLYAEGYSIEDISDTLHRNEDVVERILSECIENGKYSEFVYMSQMINFNKAMERMRRWRNEQTTETIKGQEASCQDRRKDEA